MTVFALSSFPIEQVPDLAALEQRQAASFAAREYPHRLLAFSSACSMRAPMRTVRRTLAADEALAQMLKPLRQALSESDADCVTAWHAVADECRWELRNRVAAFPALRHAVELMQGGHERPDRRTLALAIDRALWRLPWGREMLRFYDALEARHLRAAQYLLVTWEPSDVTADALAATLRYAFGRSVTALDSLPQILPCAYREHATRLEPLESVYPWLALLHSYDMQDVWDATTLHPLLAVPFDVAIAVDIVTLGRVKAQRVAELAYNAAKLVAGDASVLDTRAQRVLDDAQLALHEMARQTLHEIQIGVMVAGRTAEELEVNVADIRDRLGPRLRLMRAAGCQGEVVKLWSMTPRNRIDAPWKPRTQLSHAVGCMAGIVGMHRASATDGLFLGVDALRRAPIFMDLFANNQAAHTVVLGKTGYGKTVFMNTIAERAAAVAGMQVIGIDMFLNGERVAAALGGAACYRIGLEQTVNILDIVYGDDTQGGWIANQALHVVAQLALLLGQPGQRGESQCLVPRTFSTRERGVLSRLVRTLYEHAGVTPATPIDAVPVLSDLLVVLDQDGDEVAEALALDLRYLLYGTRHPDGTTLTAEGQAFNGHTTVDWNFLSDVVSYDFSDVPALLRPFYYLQAIGAINRYLRRPGRDRRRKIFLQIDEFGYAAQTEEVGRLAADLCKTARKYGVGVMLVDQNPLTFLETTTGRQIFENAVAKILFHLEDIAARQMGAAMSDLTSDHVAFLTQAGPGQCLAAIKNDVYHVNVELHPLELRAFAGS